MRPHWRPGGTGGRTATARLCTTGRAGDAGQLHLPLQVGMPLEPGGGRRAADLCHCCQPATQAQCHWKWPRQRRDGPRPPGRVGGPRAGPVADPGTRRRLGAADCDSESESGQRASAPGRGARSSDSLSHPRCGGCTLRLANIIAVVAPSGWRILYSPA